MSQAEHSMEFIQPPDDAQELLTPEQKRKAAEAFRDVVTDMLLWHAGEVQVAEAGRGFVAILDGNYTGGEASLALKIPQEDGSEVGIILLVASHNPSPDSEADMIVSVAEVDAEKVAHKQHTYSLQVTVEAPDGAVVRHDIPDLQAYYQMRLNEDYTIANPEVAEQVGFRSQLVGPGEIARLRELIESAQLET